MHCCMCPGRSSAGVLRKMGLLHPSSGPAPEPRQHRYPHPGWPEAGTCAKVAVPFAYRRVMTPSKQARFTFRTTAVFFFLSAFFDLFSLGSDVPLFGTLRGGVTAVIYHVLYIGIFVTVGVGLWKAKRWGARAVLAATVIYTLDRIQRMLSPATLSASLRQDLGAYAALLSPAESHLIRQTTVAITWVLLVCWWAFAWYTYAQRDYFRQSGS